MKFTSTLMEFDKPNTNGRIYSREAAEKIVDFLQTNPIGPTDNTGYTDYASASFVVEDASIEDDRVIVTVSALDTPAGQYLKDVISVESAIRFHTVGVGNLEADGRVTKYVIRGIGISLRD